MATNDQISAQEKEFILLSVHEGKTSPEISQAINERRAQAGEDPVSFGVVDTLVKRLFADLTSADWDINVVKAALDQIT